MPIIQSNPRLDLPTVAHYGLLPGEGRVIRPPVVDALLAKGDGILSWLVLGPSDTPEVSVTYNRIEAEVAEALATGAFMAGEVRAEGVGEVVEAYIRYKHGPAYLVARLPIDADVPKWAS